MSRRIAVRRSAGQIVLLCALLAGAVWGGRRLRDTWQSVDAPILELSSTVDTTLDQSPLIVRGKILYLQHCEKCHGANGAGDGEGLRPMSIRPRDFHSQQWRFRKTQESIANVIREGIPGTSMPSLRNALSEDDISQLANFVLELSDSGSGEESRETSKFDQLIRAGFSPVIPAAVPDIIVTDFEGKKRSLTDGHPFPMIVHFWGTSCTHCLAEMPRLDRLIPEVGDELTVLSICADQTDPIEIQSFATDYPHLKFFVDESGLALHRFSTSLLPSFFLVDASGMVVGARHEMLSDDTKIIKQALEAAR